MQPLNKDVPLGSIGEGFSSLWETGKARSAAIIQRGMDAIKESGYSKNYVDSDDVYGGPIGYAGVEVPPEYMITVNIQRPKLFEGGRPIHKRNKTRPDMIEIRAPLQEEFQMKTESSWSPMTAATLVTRLTGEAFSFFNRAPTNRFVTRRIWRGTTPLTFTLNLHFEAEYDAYREVKAPCMELQRLDLPYRGTGRAGEWFLSPPGPSPFQFWQPGSKFNGELIHVKIGKLLTIKHAVVKEATVKVFNCFGKGGKMMGGICTLTFETFEIQTKESLNSEVWNGESTVQDSPMTSPPCGPTSCG